MFNPQVGIVPFYRGQSQSSPGSRGLSGGLVGVSLPLFCFALSFPPTTRFAFLPFSDPFRSSNFNVGGSGWGFIPQPLQFFGQQPSCAPFKIEDDDSKFFKFWQ